VEDGPSPLESEKSQFSMAFFGRLDEKKGGPSNCTWRAYRNASSRVLATMGRDSGFDSSADLPQVSSLRAYLDRLEQSGGVPKMVIYNANPATITRLQP